MKYFLSIIASSIVTLSSYALLNAPSQQIHKVIYSDKPQALMRESGSMLLDYLNFECQAYKSQKNKITKFEDICVLESLVRQFLKVHSRISPDKGNIEIDLNWKEGHILTQNFDLPVFSEEEAAGRLVDYLKIKQKLKEKLNPFFDSFPQFSGVSQYHQQITPMLVFHTWINSNTHMGLKFKYLRYLSGQKILEQVKNQLSNYSNVERLLSVHCKEPKPQLNSEELLFLYELKCENELLNGALKGSQLGFENTQKALTKSFSIEERYDLRPSALMFLELLELKNFTDQLQESFAKTNKEISPVSQRFLKSIQQRQEAIEDTFTVEYEVQE